VHERLASYKAPRIVYVVDDLPRTRNGKVLRRELRPEQARARAQV
jgi:acyl-coenzyme A synthetase/AMP-(fatty) acid ligase